MRRPWLALGCRATGGGEKENISVSDYFLAVISSSWFIVLCGCLKVKCKSTFF
jgi:hypothetical protein